MSIVPAHEAESITLFMIGSPEAAVFGIAAGLTAVALRRELPAQYVLTVAAVMYAISALAYWLLREPCWWLPLVVLNSRGVSRLILFKLREHEYHGWWVIALTCALSAILTRGWLPSFLALIMQIAAIPWMIKRRPGKDHPGYFPLVNWLFLAVWLLIHIFNFSFPAFHL